MMLIRYGNNCHYITLETVQACRYLINHSRLECSLRNYIPIKYVDNLLRQSACEKHQLKINRKNTKTIDPSTHSKHMILVVKVTIRHLYGT